jgi:hypothetical protein
MPGAHISVVRSDEMGRRGPKKRVKRPRHDRYGRKPLQAFVDDSIAIAFKVVGAENLKTDSAMMHEAIGLLLRSYGKEIPADLRTKLMDEGLYDHYVAAVKVKAAVPG